ncbi:MAG: glycosyltransferase [Clostridiaceae bacterium]|nr:glycosyltransferase [Clostridiaceae bacterium]
MKIVFVSNFLNHHQLPLCNAFQANNNVEFTFIATEPVPDERIKLGYADINHTHNFVLCAYNSKENLRTAKKLCKDCDLLIIGSAPNCFAQGHSRRGQIVFFYSERLFKETNTNWKTVARTVKYTLLHGKYKGRYLLCASAYAAADYAKTGNFINRAYKWGYFPEVKQYNIDSLMKRKTEGVITILWVGRLIGWKHPEASVHVAERLKGEGYNFQMNIIGTGTMEAGLREQIDKANLCDCVSMLGSIPSEKVREYMELADIFLFTSDSNEGWGAVLNEAMNSGCAVLASNAIGSVPYLVKDKENGLIFQSENWDELYEKVKLLQDNPKLCNQYGRRAYCILDETWNAKVAVERLLCLVEYLNHCENTPFSDGPCSEATR